MLTHASPLNAQSGHCKVLHKHRTTLFKRKVKVVSVNQSNHRNPSSGNLRRRHWTFCLVFFTHHHDSGSCNLCLRSGWIQEWRERGPVEEQTQQHNKPFPNTPKPNHPTDYLKGEIVKRVPTLSISKKLPRLSVHLQQHVVNEVIVNTLCSRRHCFLSRKIGFLIQESTFFVIQSDF